MTSDTKRTKLFVGSLHPSVTEGDLIHIFSSIGKVSKVDYLWHLNGPYRGQPRGFAFVEYIDGSDAAKAKHNLDRKVVRGKRISVDYSTENSLSLNSKQSSYSSRDSADFKSKESSNLKATTGFKRIRALDDQINDIKVDF